LHLGLGNRGIKSGSFAAALQSAFGTTFDGWRGGDLKVGAAFYPLDFDL
jgi:hypothetical protein